MKVWRRASYPTVKNTHNKPGHQREYFHHIRHFGCHHKPDRSLVYRREVSSLSSGCTDTCQGRSRRRFGPSSPCRPFETEAEEEFIREVQPTPALQHHYAERLKVANCSMPLSPTIARS
ncbi:hypothetical protein DPMN_093772 [Dreissena polymorpha]|uniref:Uncharacterized protein n=1 Tax=Dreissena polymorpha TaxID=45954 RepID=A0A9D4L661_DREPO|nr:hypothetical protein DPMN_093772 [Dreissena polymorpha]